MTKPVGKSDETYDISLQDLINGFHELKASKGTHSMQAVTAFYAGALIQRLERLVSVLEAHEGKPATDQGSNGEFAHTNGANGSTYQRSAFN